MEDMESLYQQYYEDVFRFLRGLSADEGLAEELTQDTFFRAFKEIGLLFDKSEHWACVSYHRAKAMIRKCIVWKTMHQQIILVTMV